MLGTCRVLRFMYSDGGLYKAYRVLRFMSSNGGLYKAYRASRFMFADVEGSLRHIGC